MKWHSKRLLYYVRTSIVVLLTITSLSSRSSSCLAFQPPSSIPSSHNNNHNKKAKPIIDSKTKLYNKKWGPRWNPTPDSEYYRKGGDDDDLLNGYSNIYFSRKRKRNTFVAVYSKSIFSIQKMLVVLNTIFFVKQIQSSIQYLPILNNLLQNSNYPYDLYTKFDIVLEQFILGSAPTVVQGRSSLSIPGVGRAYSQPSLIVASTLGPFTMDFVNQRLLTRIQPHRYLSSGFIHGNIIHLLFNMNYLRKIPNWVENNGGSGNGVLGGWVLYLITYLLSILSGNLVRDYFTTTSVGMNTLCLGASGGICGLNGLMFIMLQRMGNTNASTSIMKNMAFMLLFGSLARGISNAAHIGGFLCGIVMGYLFGPNYRKAYSSAASKRWNFDDNDDDKHEGPSRDYKMFMGAGMEPDRPNVPLKYLFACLGLILTLRSELWVIPEYVWMGFRNPGALSGMVIN